MLLIYQGIVLLIVVLVCGAVLRSDSRAHQATGAMVLIPLLLRLILVK